ncbi:probable inactive tRNA-specific adenosine deaminase-like protein 3 [Leptopilina heterotoma]|uniref:probable inactive tRNA-specific adenosine deaminase-like protein 3 n=1 Tax=Leptopilina heterotoma TaxID=63436 RepID=UPI001CA8DE76|nr:probable inactive tRNA-specific adenosine deaminase-like protein 3 [Leptopilina heterotoma]
MSGATKKTKLEFTTRTWTAKPVLPPELREEPSYIEFYIGILKDKKTISKAIQSISQILPGFHHLKRCSNQKILICPCRESLSDKEIYLGENCNNLSLNLSSDDVKAFLEKKGFDLSLLEDNFEIISVPLRAPKTKIQASKASKVWPVNFHPDIRLEAVLSGKEFNDKQLDSMEKCMRIIIEAAKRESIGNENCGGSAMIVDPESGQILALATAKINQHPMYHASMLAIDLVAKSQGGGVWNLNNDDNATKRKISSLHDMTHQDKLENKRKFHSSIPLCYPTMSDIVFPELEPLTKNTHTESKLEIPKMEKFKNSEDDSNNSYNSNNTVKIKEGPYLCTGYWVFLLQEPCPLCAMALLHSRVGKIFYGMANVSSGVLGSKTVLHSLPGLNHRYQVWCGILESECKQMAEIIP